MNSPVKHLENLLLCLSDNKRPIGFLLGAGCPYSIKVAENSNEIPLLPNMVGLTQHVASSILGDEVRTAYRNICAQMIESGNASPNIEHILSQVRDLINIVSRGASVGVSEDCLKSLEKEICSNINTCMQTPLPNTDTPLHQLANWIASADRDKPVEIFTTNYDLLIEQALEETRVPFFDGFPGSRKPFFDPFAIEHDAFPSRWARVWKLHGSINWRCTEEKEKTVCRTLDDSFGTLTIHPSHMKYEQSRKMPYLAMMDRLKKFIASSESVLFILGYSFGDEHLNDLIRHSLQSSPRSAVFALMFGAMNSSEVHIAADIAKSRGNLIVLCSDGAVIGRNELTWGIQQKPSGIGLPPGTIEWSQAGPDEQYGELAVKIGDFAVFGKLLQAISGQSEG